MIDYHVWIDSLLKPKETFLEQKTKAAWDKAIINLVIAGVISGIIVTLFSMGFGAVSIIVLPILQVIGSLVLLGIVFLIAKVLGAKGSYLTFFYLVSIYSVPMAVLSMVPIVNLLAGLYTLYLFYLVLVHGLEMSSGRAIATILILIALVILIALLLAAALVGMIAAAGLGSLAMTQP